MMGCVTCEEHLEDEVNICLCCAQFCHAGHKLKKINLGKKGKATCDCGAGNFDSCPDLNSQNPLKNVGVTKETWG
jgi:hypothetical protein